MLIQKLDTNIFLHFAVFCNGFRAKGASVFFLFLLRVLIIIGNRNATI
jgi:uncharacterized membrane protein